jgi:hypothetical protein
MEDLISHEFEIGTSRLMKGDLRRALKATSKTTNCELTIDEDYGLLYGMSYFEVTGTVENVKKFLKIVKDNLEAWNAEN